MKFPVKFLVAVLAFIIGITGLIICVVPHYGPEKVVYNYLTAAEEGNIEKMLNCTIASQLSSEFGGALVQEALSQATATEIQSDVFGVPEDGNLVEVEVLGYAVEEAVVSTMAGYDVTALIKTIYTDAEGAQQEKIIEESFSLIDTGRGLKISLF